MTAVRTRAAVLHAVGRGPVLEEVELDALRDDEVLVRIAGVGVCHTDLAVADGAMPLRLPAVLGHEGAGVVEAVGAAVTRLAPGDHVVLSFDHCGTCPACAAGRPAYCHRFAALNSSGRRADGSITLSQAGTPVHGSFLGQSSLAGYAIASERNAVRIDDCSAPLELLGPLGCSLQTGAGAVLEVLAPRPGDSVAVVGLGAVGLAAVMAAASASAEPIVGLDPDARRRALALEVGATHVLDPTGPDASAVIRAMVRGGGVGHSVDAVGTQEALDVALGVLASPGRCATVGFRGPDNRLTIDQGRLLFGRSLIGVIEGDVDPHEFIPRLVALHAAGRFPFERLMTAYPLSQLDAALQDARGGRVIKAVLVP